MATLMFIMSLRQILVLGLYPLQEKCHCVHEAFAEGEQKIIVLGLPVFSIVCGDGVGTAVFM